MITRSEDESSEANERGGVSRVTRKVSRTGNWYLMIFTSSSIWDANPSSNPTKLDADAPQGLQKIFEQFIPRHATHKKALLFQAGASTRGKCVTINYIYIYTNIVYKYILLYLTMVHDKRFTLGSFIEGPLQFDCPGHVYVFFQEDLLVLYIKRERERKKKIEENKLLFFFFFWSILTCKNISRFNIKHIQSFR